jgi:hypothetical protein
MPIDRQGLDQGVSWTQERLGSIDSDFPRTSTAAIPWSHRSANPQTRSVPNRGPSSRAAPWDVGEQNGIVKAVSGPPRFCKPSGKARIKPVDNSGCLQNALRRIKGLGRNPKGYHFTIPQRGRAGLVERTAAWEAKPGAWTRAQPDSAPIQGEVFRRSIPAKSLPSAPIRRPAGRYGRGIWAVEAEAAEEEAEGR